jgi:putative transposase
MRKEALVEHNYYHIYNRGVDKRSIFINDSDYWRFILSIILLNEKQDGLMIRWRDFRKGNRSGSLSEFLTLNVRKREPIVEINAYSLMSNHFHFLLKQTSEKGIEKFMQKLGNSYTKYFNEKYKRNGSLFQGTFKSSHIKSGGQLLRMSVYVNCNSEIHNVSPAEKYKWCGFSEYIGTANRQLCAKKDIISHFKNKADYKNYAEENILDFREKKADQELILEE